MIRRSGDRIIERPEHKFGAPGFITVRNLINSSDELNGKGRVFAHTTVLPGNGIGFHVHQGDTELYYVVSGKGEYNDNGTMTVIEAGDVTFTPSGTGHGVTCIGTEPLELIALILYD
ncbi:MAG: cupin domain-containing protein [Clostridia bacterium]|nr:cupin domain-containing protein [Clostridia bacterium]